MWWCTSLAALLGLDGAAQRGGWLSLELYADETAAPEIDCQPDSQSAEEADEGWGAGSGSSTYDRWYVTVSCCTSAVGATAGEAQELRAACHFGTLIPLSKLVAAAAAAVADE
eukprot:COSAG01_NODE_584_length_15174_cov_27.387901_7_plen_113_part_00